MKDDMNGVKIKKKPSFAKAVENMFHELGIDVVENMEEYEKVLSSIGSIQEKNNATNKWYEEFEGGDEDGNDECASDIEDNADEYDMDEDDCDDASDFLEDDEEEDEEPAQKRRFGLFRKKQEEEYEDEDEFDFGDDEVIYEVTCPVCGEVIDLDEEMMDAGSIACPKCGENLEFDDSEEE